MSYQANHFSLSLPSGPNQNNIPALLDHLAEHIKSEGDISILDITFHVEVVDGEEWPSFTVFYNKNE